MPRASALMKHPVMSSASDLKQKFASSHVTADGVFQIEMPEARSLTRC